MTTLVIEYDEYNLVIEVTGYSAGEAPSWDSTGEGECAEYDITSATDFEGEPITEAQLDFNDSDECAIHELILKGLHQNFEDERDSRGDQLHEEERDNREHYLNR